MKNIYNKFILFLCIMISSLDPGFSQASSSNELSFEVNRIYPYISISKEVLSKASRLIDLNKDYKSSWVRTYLSVEVSTTYKGEIVKSVSEDNSLSQEQKDMMNRADVGSDISVLVKYLPENRLTHNDPKKMNFTLTVDPENEATFPGGQEQLEKYLKEKAIDKIPDNSFKDYDLAAVKFAVSEKGEIVNAHLFGSEYRNAKDEAIDELLLETIRNMPLWKPAEYANGTKVSQAFVLTVGNMENCMIHTLSIRRN